MLSFNLNNKPTNINNNIVSAEESPIFTVQKLYINSFLKIAWQKNGQKNIWFINDFINGWTINNTWEI